MPCQDPSQFQPYAAGCAGDERSTTRGGRGCGFVHFGVTLIDCQRNLRTLWPAVGRIGCRRKIIPNSLGHSMKVIRGKRALITGAASGIGRAIAFALADADVHVWLVDVDVAGLADVAEQVRARGVEAVASTCDLRDPQQISAVIRDLLSRWNGVDILVNNAGVGFYGPTESMTAGQWDRLLAVNLSAPIQITRELLPSLLARDEAHILNVCSIFGLVAFKRMAAYHASKFAMVGFSRALRAEYVRRGLGVTAICPGFVRTNIFSDPQAHRHGKPVPPPPWWMLTTPDHVATAALRAIRKNRAVMTVTPAARVIWWIDRLIPGVIDFLQRTPWRKRRKRASSPPPGKN